MNAIALPSEATEALVKIPFQPASLDIWSQKYQLTDKDKTPVDHSIRETYHRIAKALSEVERNPDHWYPIFLDALFKGAIPAGRIISNAGAGQYKPETSLINCTVSGAIQDSMNDILGKLHEAGLTLKAGCGIGYEFSTLRPKDAYVAGAGAYTSGPLSFMDIYDKMCFTVSSAGGRRGAQMATFDICHPDVLDFIKAKRENGRLRQFNLSLLITQDFIDAVNADAEWKLSFPVNRKELNGNVCNFEIIYRPFPVQDPDYVVNEIGHTACKVYKTLPARRLWDVIMASTYDYAEPGFIMIDRVNKMNNLWFCENIRATNPCGEQPLPDYGSCLLGSINLTGFVKQAFTDEAYFDFVDFANTVRVFTRMLDNVVEINGLALDKQRDELLRKRRHGMGFFGLGSAIAMLGMTYGDDESCEFTYTVSQQLALAGFETGIELAQEKGAAPIMDEVFTVTEAMLHSHGETLAQRGIKVGDTLTGKELMAASHYFNRPEFSELAKGIAVIGCRFTHHSSIAPTGTIALSLGNNASNGIEPSFSHIYSRNVIIPGKKTKEKVNVYSYELLAYAAHLGMTPEQAANMLPANFVSSDSISPKAHVDIQAAAQIWVDSSISKTINVPTEIGYDDFKSVYLYAAEQGLKGCTTFRYNPEAFQGVLVKEQDLENTTYQFTLADGSTLEVKGNDEIEYDGETHTAANLFDALKEGYYGKF